MGYASEKIGIMRTLNIKYLLRRSRRYQNGLYVDASEIKVSHADEMDLLKCKKSLVPSIILILNKIS